MKATLGEIIKKFRKENGVTLAEFAAASGLSLTYINQLEFNKRPKSGKEIVPSVATIKKAANAMFMSFDELFEMINEDESTVKVDRKTLADRAIRIPVLGRVAAGIPITAVENILDYEEISLEMALKGEYFGLRVKGDSMEPRIYNKSTLIVRQQEDVESGDIAVVLVDNENATCKKVVKFNDGIQLISFNPKYEPMYYSKDQIMSLPVVIIGKVVEVRTKFE